MLGEQYCLHCTPYCQCFQIFQQCKFSDRFSQANVIKVSEWWHRRWRDCCYRPCSLVDLATLACSRRKMEDVMIACRASSIADWCMWRSRVRVQQLLWWPAWWLSPAGTHTSSAGLAESTHSNTLINALCLDIINGAIAHPFSVLSLPYFAKNYTCANTYET